ncbi:MAG: sulfite exporter TauE/SafE family protein [Rhodospirillales bacterium]|nr:sulfite exporter TauE/SafE family protein [Rhodospirillales bacterium]
MLPTLLTAVFGVLAAALLRGFTGFGFGLAAVPLLSLALPPTEVVPLVVVLQTLVGLAGLRGAWRLCDWRAIRGLFPGLLLGVPVGIAILTEFAPNQVRLVIGSMIAASVLVLWRGLRLPPNPSAAVTLVVGLLSGVMSGLSSMGGPPIVVYLLALAHGPAEVRATSIVYFMLAAVVSLVPMTWRGLIHRDTLIWTAVCLPVLFGGSWAGAWAFRRARPHHHRTTAPVVLSVLATVLIARALL